MKEIFLSFPSGRWPGYHQKEISQSAANNTLCFQSLFHDTHGARKTSIRFLKATSHRNQQLVIETQLELFSFSLSLLKLLILLVMQLKYFAVRFLMLLCVSTVCYFWLSFRNQLSGTGFCLQFTTLTKQITSCHIPPSQLSHSTQHSAT